ncbi:MAG: hypothetical protein EOO59_20850 [Hymenobacter sp.]|nr:MAG: hypothetical protein EOO59_20850 [Hymenobacter sp.]
MLPWPPLSGWGPHWLRHLLALVDGLLAVADGLDFICSGAWLLPYADELVASAKANAPATSSSSG